MKGIEMIQGLLLGPILLVGGVMGYKIHKDLPPLALLLAAIAIFGFSWILASIAQLIDRLS